MGELAHPLSSCGRTEGRLDMPLCMKRSHFMHMEMSARTFICPAAESMWKLPQVQFGVTSDQ